MHDANYRLGSIEVVQVFLEYDGSIRSLPDHFGGLKYTNTVKALSVYTAEEVHT